MKTNLFLAIATLFALGPVASGDEKGKASHKHEHGHDHGRIIQGPNKGRVLHDIDPHAELLVTKDRKLQFTFLDGKLKEAAPKGQSISVICGKRSSPTRMKFSKKGNAFLSDKALPAGEHIPTVIQFKMKPGGKTKIVRLNLNLEQCGSCEFLEYTCTCDHHHEGDDK